MLETLLLTNLRREETRFDTWTSSKFKFAFTSDIPIVRSVEMQLIEAEAMARLGDETEAANLLYELQKNRDVNAIPSGNIGELLIDEILVERRKELYGEIGVEWYDAKDSALEFQGQEIIELKVLPIYNPMTKNSS